jgi:hypothetical protein
LISLLLSSSWFPLFPLCCRPLYEEVIYLCLDLGEPDAAVAIVADLETTGITVSDQTLDRVISAKQEIDGASNGDMDA